MSRSTLAQVTLSRREFLGSAAGLSFTIAVAGTPTIANARTSELTINAWVRIAPDDQITIITPAAEMGQGSMTGVPVALAEEMDADWAMVTLEMAPARPDIYGYSGRRGKSMRIVGSRAIRSYFEPMRIAGARVRKYLMQAAADEWRVDVEGLITEPGTVIDPRSGLRLSYGQIASFADAASELPEVSIDELKAPGSFRLIGKPLDRVDIPAKVDGSAMFSIDVRLPKLVYASTVHAPVQLAEPLSWNENEVRALPGVIGAIPLQHGVAVVADSFEQVLLARKVLRVQWSDQAAAEGYDSVKTLEQDYTSIIADDDAPRTPVATIGDVDEAFASASRTYKSSFSSDYAYHAQMEPLNAVARFNEAGDHVEIWEGTQAPDDSVKMIAAALGFRPDQVTHHQQYMGGAFGRRSITDYTIEAALIARAINRPVKMIWTREEDLAFGMFRPQSLQCVEAALDTKGNISGWRHCVVGDGGSLLYSGINPELYYDIPNTLVEQRGVSHGIRLKHWRAVAHPFNIFAIEGLVDEMAADAGLDPLEFRRARMSLTPKAANTFNTVEKMSDWHKPRDKGRALGLSVTERSGSLGAGVVEISLDVKRGKIRVHKVWLAVDGGIIVQPEMARRNIESG
ncbi:MAG: molybdopterin-dependent oxidoreductase, partial [Gammaproteobacteria bacterium]|nr:molybdopterin-dependent oxidoreductase [Gammaproteobacteria bacterium]